MAILFDDAKVERDLAYLNAGPPNGEKPKPLHEAFELTLESYVAALVQIRDLREAQARHLDAIVELAESLSPSCARKSVKEEKPSGGESSSTGPATPSEGAVSPALAGFR